MNAYFGKLYTSGQAKLRYDIPGKFPVYLEPGFTINNFDYYRSSNAFIADLKPSYLVQYDRSYSMNAGIPVRNKGKLELIAIVYPTDFAVKLSGEVDLNKQSTLPNKASP